jgi:hypothetical protein
LLNIEKKINEWEELHPNWEDNEQMQDEYIYHLLEKHIHINMKNIAKETFIYN